MGVSGTGNLRDDVKVAGRIAATWSGQGKGVMKINSSLKDSKIMIPPWVLQKAHGICFLFFIRAGFNWSGELGSGFIIAKVNKGTPQERWSAPTGVSSGGMGFGFQIGAQKQYHIVVLNSKNALRTFTSKGKLNIGGDIGVAAGPVGRNADVKLDVGTKGIAASYSYSFSQGAFAGIAINGAVIAGNSAMNRKFYGRDISATTLMAGADGLREADSSPEYRMLHEYLSISLGGNRQNFTVNPSMVPGASVSGSTANADNDGFDVDYFGLSSNNSMSHAGADGFTRSTAAATTATAGATANVVATGDATASVERGSYNAYTSNKYSYPEERVEDYGGYDRLEYGGSSSQYGYGQGDRDDAYERGYGGSSARAYGGYGQEYDQEYDRNYDRDRDRDYDRRYDRDYDRGQEYGREYGREYDRDYRRDHGHYDNDRQYRGDDQFDGSYASSTRRRGSSRRAEEERYPTAI